MKMGPAPVATISLCLIGLAAEAAGQESANPPPQPTSAVEHRRDRTPRFIVGVLGGYGKVQRTSGGAQLFIPLERWRCGDGICGGAHVELLATAGQGGWRIAAGFAPVGFPFWQDVLVTVTRTRSDPRGASPQSTYVGLDAGFSFPMGVWGVREARFAGVRPSIGVARRVQESTAPQRTIFTWGIGAHILWRKF